MKAHRLDPLAGVVAVTLWILGTFLLEKDTAAFVAWVVALPTLGFFGLVVGLPLWTLLVSVLLYRTA